MFFFRHKIRKLNELLSGNKLPEDLNQIKEAIEKTAPAPARAQFQKNLRSRLLQKHSAIARFGTSPEDIVEVENDEPAAIPFWKKGWKFGLALVLIITISGAISYPLIPAPQVEGYYLKASVRKVSSNAPLKIVFSQPMDKGSVERAFHINPEIEGSLSWQLNSLLFTPKTAWNIGDTFTVSLDKSARSIFQKALPYEYLETFEIVGPPQVLLSAPENSSTDVPTDAQITVHFDRPMVALTSLEEGEKLAPKLQISPATSGKVKWLGTDSIRFIPDKLLYATHYTITIPAGTLSADGGKTEKDFSYTFDTQKPQLESTEPGNNDDFNFSYNGPDTKIKLFFNQPMSPEKAKSSLHLYVYEGDKKDLTYMTPEWIKKKKNWNVPSKSGVSNKPAQTSDEAIKIFEKGKFTEVPFTVSFYTLADYKKDNAYEDQTDSEIVTDDQNILSDQSILQKTLVITPTKPFAYDQFYLVKVDKTLKGNEGNFTLGEEKKILFKTVGNISVLHTTPISNDQGFAGGVAQIDFSQPVDSDLLKEKISIDPKTFDADTKEEKKPDVTWDEDKTTFYVNYDFKPSSNYKITVQSGVKDLFGKTLNEPLVISFKTAPAAPHFNIPSPYDLAVLDGNKPPVFYVQSINVPSVHINFKKLSTEEFDKIFGSNGYVMFNKDTNPSGPFISWDKKIDGSFNQNTVRSINFAKESGTAVDPGYYYFDVSSDLLKDNNGNPVLDRHIFLVTRSGLTLKMSQKKALVWATSLYDGKPIEGMNVTLQLAVPQDFPRDIAPSLSPSVPIFTGKTDSNGLITFDVPENTSPTDFFTITGVKDDDTTLVHGNWSDGIQPWNFNISYSTTQTKYYSYIYTDRPIYRPGHIVNFKGILRADQDANFKLPDLKTVQVRIYSESSDTVFDQKLSLNANGTFHSQFTLAQQAPAGGYSMDISGISSKGDTVAINMGGTPSFRVASYRKPDYQLTITPEKENYISGEKAQIKVKGSYFFGSPMPNAEISWTVKSQDYFFSIDPNSTSPYASKWFSFSEDGSSCFFHCEGETSVVSKGKAKLDANGEYTIVLPLDVAKKKLSQIYSVEVTASDLNNQTVSDRASWVVQQGEYYLGILNDQEVTKAGKEIIFKVITVDKDGNPVPQKKVEVSFMKRNWNTIKKKNVDSDFYYENSYDDSLLDKKNVMTDAKGYAEVSFIPKDGGTFKASAASQDAFKNTITASTTVYATSNDFINWGRSNHDRIELVADKPEYKPGDTAHILIKSPYQKVNALVTYERGDVISQKVVRIESNSQTLDIPITDKFIPNIFVSVVLVKGSRDNAGLGEPAKNALDEREVAAFKIGYTTLQVNNSSKKLSIALEPNQKKYHPGDEVTMKVKTLDANGKAVKAELSIGVVDKSVLSLVENVTADLLNEFYRQRFLGVMTAETLTKALSRINVQVEAGLKGGGGGATLQKRGVFKDTAYFEAVVQTDAKGEGVVKFKLPDNLTTWQVLAIGVTDKTLVGSQKTEFVVTKDILVRPVLPRFLMVNDEMSVSGIVHNYMDRSMDLDVSLETKGAVLKGKTKYHITLAAGAEQKVDFPINVRNEKEAVFTFKAVSSENANVGDLVENVVPINTFSFPEVVATSSVISDNYKFVEKIWLPSNVDQKFGELTLSIAPTLASSITKGIEYLVQYPYGCNEQIASSLLPNLVAKQLLELPGLGKKVEKLVNPAKLKKNVETGLQALYKTQKPDGGWGLWEESKTSPYVTGYVLFTLDQAKKAGHSVDPKVLENGTNYLKIALNAKAPNGLLPEYFTGYRSEEIINDNTRSFMLYVLAEAGKGDLGLSNNLYERHKKLNLFAKSYLAMNFKLLIDQEKLSGSAKDAIDQKIAALKQEILNSAKETPRGVHFEESKLDYQAFDTNTRTTALILQMLTRIDNDNVLIPKILRHLLVERKDGHFNSTQETAVSMLALIDYLKTSKELEVDYTGTVTVNSSQKLEKSFNLDTITDHGSVTIPLSELLQNNQDNEIVAQRDGQGKMYFDMNLKYYLPTEKIKARDEGMTVHQEYFALSDRKNENPLTTVKVGENLKGRMTIFVPEDRHYVLVEDFLPAGLEGLDFSLKTTEQGLQDLGTDSQCRSWSCWQKTWIFNHSEIRDDRVVYSADFLPKGVYEIEYFVRATTPGTFHDLPTQATEMYFPEVFGRSEGRLFTVTEGT